MELVSRLGCPDETALQDSPTWYWEVGTGHKFGWNLTNSQWLAMIHAPRVEFDKCSRRWNSDPEPNGWIRMWKWV